MSISDSDLERIGRMISDMTILGKQATHVDIRHLYDCFSHLYAENLRIRDVAERAINALDDDSWYRNRHNSLADQLRRKLG